MNIKMSFTVYYIYIDQATTDAYIKCSTQFLAIQWNLFIIDKLVQELLSVGRFHDNNA